MGRNIKNLFLLTLLTITFLTRIVNLGYSDYQGDETQAFFIPQNQSNLQFLLDQKKGPVQFLVTWIVKSFSQNYDDMFITRLPFAVSGVVSGFLLYILLKKSIGQNAGLYALTLYASNGLFIAFSRIVQYQTLVMLFILLSLLSAYYYFQTGKKLWMYFSLIFWGIGLMTHSDSVFIAFPLVCIFYMQKSKWKVSNKKWILDLVIPFGSMLLFVSLYYLALVYHSSDATRSYWAGRFSGNITTGIISSTYLFRLYQPIFGLVIYEVLGVFGVLYAVYSLIVKFNVPKLFKINFSFLNKTEPSVDRFFMLGVFLWFLSALLFMEVVTKFPGTHIWTYILPLCVLIGLFLQEFEKRLYSLLRILFATMFIVLTAFLSYQSFVLFVDHSKEYPWEKQQLLFWTIDKPSTAYQVSLFGFPYFRNWKGVRDFVVEDGRSQSYVTNEKKAIPRYYLPLEKNSSNAGYILYFLRPQSSTNYIADKRASEWMRDNKPIKEFEDQGRTLVRIYLMPENWNSYLKSSSDRDKVEP